jgi:hypothetical protein
MEKYLPYQLFSKQNFSGIHLMCRINKAQNFFVVIFNCVFKIIILIKQHGGTVIPALRRQRHSEFQTNLGYIVRLVSKKKDNVRKPGKKVVNL